MSTWSLSAVLLCLAVSASCKQHLCFVDDFSNGYAKFLNQPCAEGDYPLVVKKYSEEDAFLPPLDNTNDYYLATEKYAREYCLTNLFNVTLDNPTFVFHNLAYFNANPYQLCELTFRVGNEISEQEIRYNLQPVWKMSAFHIPLSGDFKVNFKCYRFINTIEQISVYALDRVEVYSSVKEGCVEDNNSKDIIITKTDKAESNSTIVISGLNQD